MMQSSEYLCTYILEHSMQSAQPAKLKPQNSILHINNKQTTTTTSVFNIPTQKLVFVIITKKYQEYATTTMSNLDSDGSSKSTSGQDQPLDTDNANDITEEKRSKKKKVHKLTLEETEDFNEKLRKRGVVYLARVPPRMGPTKVKSLLGEFGVVTRVYLEEEDRSVRKKRQKATGNRGGKRYTEGWIEFEKKSVAKRIAQALNCTPITNHKRSVHFGDLWNVKYLPKFKWEHLSEKVAYERRMREQKLRLEMMHAKKENHAYSSLVEAGKVMDRIEMKRQKKRNREKTDTGNDSSKTIINGDKKVARKFKQNKIFDNDDDRAVQKAVLSSLV